MPDIEQLDRALKWIEENPGTPMDIPEETIRSALATAIIQSGYDDADDSDDAVQLFEWHHCFDTPACAGNRTPPDPCPCSGVPFLSAAVWAKVEPVVRLIAAQALRNGEERTEWSVWEHRPAGPSVHTLLNNPDDEDEEQWAQRRAAEIHAEGGRAEVRRRVTTVIVGHWEPTGLPCSTCNGTDYAPDAS